MHDTVVRVRLDAKLKTDTNAVLDAMGLTMSEALRTHRPDFLPEFSIVVAHLLGGAPLPLKYQDPPLQGDLKDCRDCHVRPDLVLIYRLGKQNIELVRLGSHAEVFG